MVRLCATFILTLVISFIPSGSWAIDTPVKITVYPTVSSAPATIRTHVWIAQNWQRRAACLELDGPDYYTRHCWQVEPDNERTVWDDEFRDLPTGEYQAIVEVYLAEGKRQAKAQFLVSGV